MVTVTVTSELKGARKAGKCKAPALRDKHTMQRIGGGPRPASSWCSPHRTCVAWVGAQSDPQSREEQSIFIIKNSQKFSDGLVLGLRPGQYKTAAVVAGSNEVHINRCSSCSRCAVWASQCVNDLLRVEDQRPSTDRHRSPLSGGVTVSCLLFFDEQPAHHGFYPNFGRLTNGRLNLAQQYQCSTRVSVWTATVGPCSSSSRSAADGGWLGDLSALGQSNL